MLTKAIQPSARQGCAEILGNRYHKKIPLTHIPKCRPYGSSMHPGIRHLTTSDWLVPLAKLIAQELLGQPGYQMMPNGKQRRPMDASQATN